MLWRQFRKHPLGIVGLCICIIFCIVGIYAPFLASSKPLVVKYEGEWYFPLFRYLLYNGFYTKRLDIFFNLLILTFPLALGGLFLFRGNRKRLSLTLIALFIIQMGLFAYYSFGHLKDPAADLILSKKREIAIKSTPLPNWEFDLKYMNTYAKLNLLFRFQQRKFQQLRFQKYSSLYLEKEHAAMPTLWQLEQDNETARFKRQQDTLDLLKAQNKTDTQTYSEAKANLDYILDRRQWIETHVNQLSYEMMPLIRPFHWEDDAGGSQSLNRYLLFWELTRINRKDLLAALIFGTRISLVVGILAVSLALAIALPIGAFAGFYGGKFDIIVSRLLEIWESMPTFFMLLMVVAIMQSKSIFLVIMVIGLFGWTTFSRFIRGEFFKQRNLPYVESCRAIGFHDSYIMFSHILPNAIPPVLTLLPFSIMGAITSEAGLSFLGLGEEGSCSWGVLMDEGRTAFPAESYLLWPPAILLTTLLIAIALVGDTLRDSLDPKMHR